VSKGVPYWNKLFLKINWGWWQRIQSRGNWVRNFLRKQLLGQILKEIKLKKMGCMGETLETRISKLVSKWKCHKRKGRKDGFKDWTQWPWWEFLSAWNLWRWLPSVLPELSLDCCGKIIPGQSWTLSNWFCSVNVSMSPLSGYSGSHSTENFSALIRSVGSGWQRLAGKILKPGGET
jgi:hypothetical protein